MSKLTKALTAAAGNAAGESLYVEDVFSTYLYTGNGSTQTITNGIDLAGEGGLVWIKARTNSSGVTIFGSNQLSDTALGLSKSLCSNDTTAYADNPPIVGSVSATGFVTTDNSRIAYNGNTYASWTFRKAEKFFDVVTYTGTGSAQNIAHNLGSVPGVVIVKNISASDSWHVYHISIGNTKRLLLNSTAAVSGASATYWNNTSPTDTVFTVGTNGAVNTNGQNYVAYLFAHDAGGFGADGSESIIKCGSFTADGSGAASVNLGWEPQWILHKTTSTSASWGITDSMRGMPATGSNTSQRLEPNSSLAEETRTTRYTNINSTGFNVDAPASSTSIYIAIRRPMKTPESGTEVFGSNAVTSTGSNLDVTNNINMASGSLVISHRRDSTSNTQWFDNLRGPNKRLRSNSTDPEDTLTTSLVSWNMDGFTIGTQYGSTESQVFWSFKRATGFFDVVCYSGTGANTTFTHNLGVAPELMIVKNRPSAGYGWLTYSSTLGATKFLQINSTAAEGTVSTYWNNTAPTSSVFSVGTAGATNASGDTYVAYLFATLAGVSKVGSYTGNGTSQTIDCGFSGGARFILIKSTSTTGSWWVYDSARGIVAGNDPALQLNSSAAEITSADAIDPDSSGFIVNQEATCSINASGVSYIFMSIA